GVIATVVATVARIAFAGDATLVAAQFQRRQARVFADFLGGDLVHGNTHLDVRAFGFARLTPGEERRRSASVVAGAVAVRPGLVVGQAADDLEIFPERLQRRED